jgi:hypothetical protein
MAMKAAAQPTGAREAPASCPNCHDRTDCSNVDQCNAVERAYAHPTGDVEGLVERLTDAVVSYRDCYVGGSLTGRVPYVSVKEPVEFVEACKQAVAALRSADSRSQRMVEALEWRWNGMASKLGLRG